MAEDESKPLLIRANPSWNRRGGTSSSSSSNDYNGVRRTRPLVQRSDSEILPRIEIPPSEGTSSNGCYLNCALAAILVSVIFERLTYYGFTGNLVLFLNESPLFWESYYASSALFLFFGISYIMSLIGGWIADSFLGRFKTMVVAFIIYIIGFIIMPFIAETNDSSIREKGKYPLPRICAANATKDDDVDSPFDESCGWLIYICLLIIAIGSGILKANICPFGSDQLLRVNQQTQLSFFNWFYWCVNLGSFLGLGAIAYVEQQFNFLYGFIACAASLGVSALIFLIGRWFYLSRPADGSVLTNIFRIIREAWRRKRQQNKLHKVQRKSVSEGYLSSHSEVDDASYGEQRINFLDYAKHRHGGIFHNSLVDDVKKLGLILAVFAVLIPYWIVYFQMQTTFLIQGLHMKLFFSPVHINASSIVDHNNTTPPPKHKPKVVAAWFSLFDALFVIILLPLFDRVIYPKLNRAGYPFTFAKRIVLGMLFSAAAMCVAGVVEHYRLKAFWPDPDNQCYNASIAQYIGITEYNAADMTVLWQIPQYALVGISEVFASVACLQFAVTVAPRSMKAIITGLFYFFSGVGGLLGFALVNILSSTETWFNKHDSGNINCRLPCTNTTDFNTNITSYVINKECHLDYYFYFLAGLEGLGLLLFLLVARAFKLNSETLVINARTREEVTGNGNQHVQTRNGITDTSVTS